MECTGTIHYAASLILKAIENKRDVLLFNPEVDATIGPILKVYADAAGVMLSGCEGDQPGVIMNLYRFVKGLGLTPLICGNIKGLQDFYRNPTTQAGFAARWGLTPEMVTSFADGTKISMEQACVANATGMGVAKRGMLGYTHDGHIDDMVTMYDIDELKRLGGIVDYVVGPKPTPVYSCLRPPTIPKQSITSITGSWAPARYTASTLRIISSTRNSIVRSADGIVSRRDHGADWGTGRRGHHSRQDAARERQGPRRGGRL